MFATPGFSPARAATDDRGCARGADLPVPVAHGVPNSARGKVLPGTEVRSQVVHFPPKPYVPGPNPLIDHYPDGRLPVGLPEWRNLGGVPPSKVERATGASAIPVTSTATGFPTCSSLRATRSPCSAADGRSSARRRCSTGAGAACRPRSPSQRLDHIYYGDEPGQLGQPASDHGADFNGDGRADVLLADPYYLEPVGGQLQQRGRMWLVLSTPSQRKLVDVEAAASRYIVADTALPGLFGFTWDTGDFNGDGRPDLVISDHYEGDRSLDIHAGVVYLFYNSRLRLG